MSESLPSWIKDVLAGVFVLRNVDEARATRIVQTVASTYQGPGFGGFDVMRPNAAGEAWLILGRWNACFEDEVQRAATLVHAGLQRAAELDSAGVRLEGGGAVTVAAADAIVGDSRKPVEVAPMHAYSGGVSFRWWEPGARERLEAIFPTLPAFCGTHMNAPHWFGTGMQRDGEHIVRVTPYARLDFVPDRGVAIAAMAEPAMFRSWLDALLRAAPWA